jgi:hypothetical protein
MSKTLFSRPSAIACTVWVVAAVAIGTGASPESSLAQEKRNGSSDAKVELSDFGKAVGNPGAITEVPPRAYLEVSVFLTRGPFKTVLRR